MDQLRNLADDRLLVGCLYCGGRADTRDHVPSRVFLDAPYPDNLPVVGACFDCNNGFSADEEYVACLIEVALAGTTEPDKLRRPSVANILRRSPKLRQRLESVRSVVDGVTTFKAELERVNRVAIKLARGHAGYELSLPTREAPAQVATFPIDSLTPAEREAFGEAHYPHLFPEVGSRASQRIAAVQFSILGPTGESNVAGFLFQDWQDVQADRYSYLATVDDAIRVRIVIGGYLACVVRWT